MLLLKRQWKEEMCLLLLPRQKYLVQSITVDFLMVSFRIGSSFAKTSVSLKRSPSVRKMGCEDTANTEIQRNDMYVDK